MLPTKRASLREIVLLCVPLVFIASGALLWHLRHPARGQIVLTLTRDEFWSSIVPTEAMFGWEAMATDGTTHPIALIYSQKLVASGRGLSKVIWSDPAGTLPAPSGFSNLSNTAKTNSRKEFHAGRVLDFPTMALPVWTQKLDWQGEVVAIPSEAAVGPTPATSAKLSQWEQLPGAVRSSGTFPVVLLDPKYLAVQDLQREAVSANNARLGADICISTDFNNSSRQVFRRLVAFDGKISRVLWSEQARSHNPFWKGEQSRISSSGDHNLLLFHLSGVPASWGQLTFYLDVGFDPRPSTGTGATSCDAATIEKLKRSGWISVSRQLVVRGK